MYILNFLFSFLGFVFVLQKREMVLINLTCSNSQVPPKPEPKQCTQPEPFQLESLVRHEEEMRREREERRRMETEEAQKRLFKAQPVIKE
jgi:targeting protein for Xklp2